MRLHTRVTLVTFSACLIGMPSLLQAADHPARAFAHLFEVPPIELSPAVPSFEITATVDQDQPPPKPAHIGFSALIHETGSDFKAYPRRKSTYVILAIGGAAALLAHPADDNLNGHLTGSGSGKFFAAGKYLGYAYVQAGTAIGTYLIGRYVIKSPEGKTNKISHIGFDLLRANILTQAFTYGIKYVVRRDRPDGDCCAFPSGHASVTFATASVLERHFGYRGAWPTFVIASYVAMSRLHDNRHFLSDVVFGSALGITTGWTVVGRHGREHFALMPTAVPGGVGVAFSWTPTPHATEH